MKKEKHFRILPDFMIRTAMLPLESINEIKTGDEFLTSLEKFIDEGVMGEAILVASSSLSNMLEKSNYNQKDRNSIAFSLYKYISRTFSRTTPFGLFASVGMGTFDNIQKNINFQELEFKKNSRIDMEWLLGFIDSMEKEKHIVAQLRVKANHTIVKSGKRMELLFPTHCGQGEKIEGTITDTISIRLTDAFENWVLETLQQNTYTSEQFKQYLSAYFSLTGEEITEMFWKRKNYTLSLLFPQFVERGHLEPLELLEQYLNEVEIPKNKIREKWFYMADYLQNYIKGLSSPSSYEMFMKLITSFGISNQSSMFEIEKLLWDSIGMKSDWRNQLSFSSLDFIRPFLSVEEHQELFRIIEQHIFHEYTESYVDFLVRILSDTNNFLWFEREDAKQLFHRLEPCLTDGSDLENLRRIYLTEQEISVLEEQKRFKDCDILSAR